MATQEKHKNHRTSYYLVFDRYEGFWDTPTTLNGELANSIMWSHRNHNQKYIKGDKVYIRYSKKDIQAIDKNAFTNKTHWAPDLDGFGCVAK